LHRFAIDLLKILQKIDFLFTHLWKTFLAILSHNDIILWMPENDPVPESRGGQILGCGFALLIAGFIFLVLFVFMRSC
jgi:hypothetical protein